MDSLEGCWVAYEMALLPLVFVGFARFEVFEGVTCFISVGNKT